MRVSTQRGRACGLASPLPDEPAGRRGPARATRFSSARSARGHAERIDPTGARWALCGMGGRACRRARDTLHARVRAEGAAARTLTVEGELERGARVPINPASVEEQQQHRLLVGDGQGGAAAVRERARARARVTRLLVGGPSRRAVAHARTGERAPRACRATSPCASPAARDQAAISAAAAAVQRAQITSARSSSAASTAHTRSSRRLGVSTAPSVSRPRAPASPRSAHPLAAPAQPQHVRVLIVRIEQRLHHDKPHGQGSRRPPIMSRGGEDELRSAGAPRRARHEPVRVAHRARA